jgi:hypothetical protein
MVNESAAKRVATREEVEKRTRREERTMAMGKQGEEEEEVGVKEVTMEGEDTVSPLSSKQSTERSKGNQQEEGWKQVGGKEKERRMLEATSKASIVGIKMVRIGNTGTTGWSVKDVRYFFQMLERIDPTALVINARNDKASAMKPKDMTKMNAMDYKGYLDMRNDNWGGPTENKTKTVWMCHVATDIMSPALQQLRDDEKVQEYLNAGNITMQYTKLNESNSKVAFHIANKDPKFTNKNDLEERLQRHLNQHSEKPIPIHIINMNVNGKNFSTRMCTAVVGGKDIRKVETIMKTKPFGELEIIPFVWKFQEITGYTRRLREHEEVIKLCRAIKIEEMSVEEEMDSFKEALEIHHAYQYVVDVFPATHASRTGVVYVQYINQHKETVLEMIKESIKAVKTIRSQEGIIVPFPEGPKLINNNGSVNPSIQTTNTPRTNSQIPRTKYGELLDKKYKPVSNPTQVPWAISVTNKSFMDALTGTGVRDTSSQNKDSDSEAGYTFKSGNTSGMKTLREAELEAENARLVQQLQDKEEQYKATMEHMQEEFERKRQEDKEKQEQQNQDIEQMVADNKRQIEQLMKMLNALTTNGTKDVDNSKGTEQGSTPKRQRKRQVHTPTRKTTNRNEDTSLTLADAEPIALEEGYATN